MKEILKSNWNYTLLEENNTFLLKVICGSVGIFEVELLLNNEQIQKYKVEGEKYINQLANEIRSKYQNDITVIEDALGYQRGDLSGLENELFIFNVDNTKFRFEIPNGNEIGANNLWEPGGLTSGGFREAVLIDKFNPSAQINHNKDINSLKNQFNWEKVKN